MTKSRLLSLFVSAFYLIYISITTLKNNPQNILPAVLMLLLWLLLPLLLIWFADKIGPFLGRGLYSRFVDVEPNWAAFIRFAGWLLLLLPVIMFIFRKTNLLGL